MKNLARAHDLSCRFKNLGVSKTEPWLHDLKDEPDLHRPKQPIEKGER